MEERVKADIERLTKERDAFVANANQQIAAYNGAISALQGLLTPAEKPADEPAGQPADSAAGAAS